MRSTLQEVRKENVTLKSSMIRNDLSFLGVGLRNVSFMSIVMIQKHIKFTQQERCLHYICSLESSNLAKTDRVTV